MSFHIGIYSTNCQEGKSKKEKTKKHRKDNN
jgi:hypothetical protein